jgi:hypothetical protein
VSISMTLGSTGLCRALPLFTSRPPRDGFAAMVD